MTGAPELALRSAGRPGAIAIDYDRTLTGPDLAVRPSTRDALAEARAAGVKIIVASGRRLPDLLARLTGPDGRVAVDAIVAENGALVRFPDTGETVRIAPSRAPAFHDLLRGLDGVPIELGEVIASAPAASEPRLREALRGIDATLQRNLDRIMILPSGVDKGAGVLAALARLRVAPQACAAIGDAENDLPLLCAVGHAVAVANALPEVKRVAHETLEAPGGLGVEAWIRARLRGSGAP